MVKRETLEKELARIHTMIDEAEARLGAHSVKPVLMQRLFELEEKRDDLVAQLKTPSAVSDS